MDLTRYRDIIPEWERFLGAAARPEPTVFRVRTGRISEAELCDRLHRQGFQLRPLPGLSTFFQVESGPFPVTLTFEHWHGLIYVQQASTGAAAPALGARPGERVLDLCSAPGGKTTHLAEIMEDRGCLVACEIDERRIRGLLGNVYRLGHTNILVVAGDGRHFPDGALYDRVLVDAPCSGEGTLRRRAGAPPNQSESFLRYVTATQRALLERAVRLTRPGGTILYVTCTFAPAENEAVVSAVLSDPSVDLEPLDLPIPHAPGLTSFGEARFDPRLSGAARIYPHHLDSGGLFLAKLKRTGEPAGSDEWSSVPAAFPEGGAAEEEADDLIGHGLDVLHERYGVDTALHPEWDWTVRGGRAWLHTVCEWPIGSWEDGSWRPVSVGQRALEFDTKGRPRPTNDFLRMLAADVTRGVADLSRSELDALLVRDPVSTDIELRGPIALRYNGDVIGRGAVTGAGLVSEIPKARAADLKRVLGMGAG
ncbi:MAG: RsmB/NOP family class I SAM-dependent RNA methyltransferase [Gemmatimonadota bacterium]|nr:RsmB/NOP family class I SAM-dependent RNA methyltransferase [Gemmatimonadota bacterium]MDH3423896.1 RsmB/NOP family class I SAM-dependent RNA methyltransferase [Gemmatimonadota bacterium]